MSNISKWYKTELRLQWQTDRKSGMINRVVNDH